VKSRGTPDFWKVYYALPAGIRDAARAAYGKFRENPTYPSLQLERLRSDGRFRSVRVTREYRAVVQRFEGDLWVWIRIGNHKDFDRHFDDNLLCAHANGLCGGELVVEEPLQVSSTRQ
jgi:hypothetical protein